MIGKPRLNHVDGLVQVKEVDVVFRQRGLIRWRGSQKGIQRGAGGVVQLEDGLLVADGQSIIEVAQDEQQRSEALLAVHDFQHTAGMHFDDEGLQTVEMLRLRVAAPGEIVDVFEQLRHLQRRPAVAALVGGNVKPQGRACLRVNTQIGDGFKGDGLIGHDSLVFPVSS